MNAEQLKQLENNLWNAADTLRANSGLKSSQYATPILGLIFLKFADNKYRQHESEINAEYERLSTTRTPTPIHVIAVARCGFYLPPEARYDYLLHLPESADIAGALKTAMADIEKYREFLKDCLPKDDYFALVGSGGNGVLKRLLQTFSDIPANADGDLFGQIYEYFLGKFALAEGQGGGEFFTPRSVVRLMVEIIEPHKGRVLDPACGSGGMFVQSARFVEERHKQGGTDSVDDLYVCGQEKTAETVKLAKMNLAVNGLRGEIRQGNSYNGAESYDSYENFDYVMANPPFNVDEVDVETVLNDRRFNQFGIPRNKSKVAAKAKGASGADKGKETVPNANYLWISLFASSLKAGGRAALVMANSASDAQHTEAEIRRRLIEANLIYGMLTMPSNMFYTVTLPATLWFFDKGKTDDRILFIDARRVFTQIDRAHREFTEDQVHNLATISYLNRNERSRYLRRIDDCLEAGRTRFETLRADFAAVWEPLGAALPEDDGSGDAVARAANAVRDGAGVIRGFLHDDERLAALLETEATLAATAGLVVEGMDDAAIDPRNQAQQSLATGYAELLGNVQSEMKSLERYLREYEKAAAEKVAVMKGESDADAKKRRMQERELRDAKRAWEIFTADAQTATEPFAHARWLQERFPDAKYADVIGLCKLATPEEVAAQDYSLNPGRYVGVVIEEDGKTAEEFRADLLAMNAELEKLNAEAAQLATVISHNVLQMAGAE